MTERKLSGNETIKRESSYLRGDIAAELADLSRGDVSDAAYELLKFHGSYFGYDRDTATERKKQGLEKQWEFMLRLKMPGGRLTAEQYLKLDELCDLYANGTLRITTRETFQFHCVVKKDFKPFVAAINRALMSTVGGCGDIVRNIITCPAPIKDNIHAVLEQSTFTLAKLFAPKSMAHYEIFLDGEVIYQYPFLPEPSTTGEVEPLYGESYMPRKFKVAIGQPEDNCMDALCNDLAILALFDGQELKGYNFALGGGLGMNHNNAKTYPHLARPVAFVKPQDLYAAAEAVVKLQRDHGDRSDRKHARLKYVIAEKGTGWAKEMLETYLGRTLDAPLPFPKFGVVEHTGWHPQGDGKWFLGVPVSSGRVVDREGERIRTGLREVVREYKMPLILTADQNIILYEIEESEKPAITQKLRAHGIKLTEDISPAYRNFIACVALPTCGKALAEAERVKLPMVGDIEKVMQKHGVEKERITIRLAGCPNGCSRPYVGDISIVGRMPDHYSIYIGGDFEGTRLGEKIFDRIPLDHLPEIFDPMFALYGEQKQAGEGFGDFCLRYGIPNVKQTTVDRLGADTAWLK